MIEVEMSDDIRKYEPKAFGPFTKRQAICVSITAVFGYPLYEIIRSFGVDFMTTVMVIAIIFGPILLCGWITIDGCPPEMMVMRIIYLYLLTPPKRKYKVKNTYRELEKKEDERIEKLKLKKMNSKQRKNYLKNKTKTVVYSKSQRYKLYK